MSQEKPGVTLSESEIVTGNTSHTRPENRAFYPALDGLRAIAFLMVFFVHYCGLPWGWTGVSVFFVLSGFLITGILYDSLDDPNRARNFYIRRTLRIFPLYYAIFLILLLLSPFMHWQWSRSWIAWPLYMGNYLRFLSPASSVAGSARQLSSDAQIHTHLYPALGLYMGHFWSLCVEEQFYLVWPWVVFWVRSRRVLLWICGITVVVVPILRVVTQDLAPAWMLQSELLYRATPFELDALLLGGLIGLLWRGPHQERLLQVGRWVAAVAAVATVVYLARTLHPSDGDWFRTYHYPTWRLTWGLSFVNVFSAAVILCVLRPSGWLYWVLKLPPLRWMGRVSYGAYVLHDIFHERFAVLFLWLCRGSIHYGSVRLMVVLDHFEQIFPPFALGMTFLLAWLSFKFLESPFLNLKERWTIPWKRGARGVDAPAILTNASSSAAGSQQAPTLP